MEYSLGWQQAMREGLLCCWIFYHHIGSAETFSFYLCTVVNVYYFDYLLIFLENYNLLFYTSSRIGSKTRYSRIACAAEANSAE
jgi:hypothetical protein